MLDLDGTENKCKYKYSNNVLTALFVLFATLETQQENQILEVFMSNVAWWIPQQYNKEFLVTVTAFCPSNLIKDPQRMAAARLSYPNVLNLNG